MKKTKSGISLIVLVITILVLAILATTVIITVSNTNAIDQANKATFKSDMSSYKEVFEMYVASRLADDSTFDRTTLNLEYSDDETLFNEIFGSVASKYQKGLRIANGKLIYKTTDESEKEVLESIGMAPDKMSILATLENCTSSNTSSSVEFGESYTTELTVMAGYTIQTVTVTMAGEDITASVYNKSKKTITIPEVTGKVEIFATTDVSTYTITKTLTNATLSNTDTRIKHGNEYTATVTPNEGHVINSVTVTMDGTEVASAYDEATKTITVAEVTGKLEITVKSKLESEYIGYYVDADGDGTVDSVIFADLAYTASGKWGTSSDGAWNYKAQSDLKEYTTTGETYPGKFGTNPILEVSNDSGNDRFYVMALSNFTAELDGTSYSTFCWYAGAYNKISSSKTLTGFGKGKTNTTTMIDLWNAGAYTQNDGSKPDVWGVIQDEVDKGWFLPSRAEWAAFASAFDITNSNDSSTYGLNNYYWSSSLLSSDNVWDTSFGFGRIYYYRINTYTYVRLAATF